jgi:hypothetical protein
MESVDYQVFSASVRVRLREVAGAVDVPLAVSAVAAGMASEEVEGPAVVGLEGGDDCLSDGRL